MCKWLLRSFGVLAVFVLIGAAVGLRPGLALMRIGTGYAAKQTCSCVFISGRTKENCQKDLEPLARRTISISIAQGEPEVWTHAFGWVRARARYQRNLGCSLIE